MHLDPYEIMQAKRTEGIIKPQGIGTIDPKIEENNGKIHKLKLEKFHYFPGAPKCGIVQVFVGIPYDNIFLNNKPRHWQDIL